MVQRIAVGIVGLMVVAGVVLATGGASGRASLPAAQEGSPEATPRPRPVIACLGEPIVPTFEVVFRFAPDARAGAVDRALATITSRAEALAPEGCRLWREEGGVFLLQLAGEVDPGSAVQALTANSVLEVIDPDGVTLAPGATVRTSRDEPRRGNDESGTPTTDPGAQAEPVYRNIFDSDDIVAAELTVSAAGQTIVSFTLDPEEAERVCDYTERRLGQPLAIVIDKVVIATPVINAPICGGQGVIEGLTASEATTLAAQFQTEPLTIAVEIIAAYSVIATAV